MNPGMIGDLRGPGAQPRLRTPWEIDKSSWVRAVENDPDQFPEALKALSSDPFLPIYLCALVKDRPEWEVPTIAALPENLNSEAVTAALADHLLVAGLDQRLRLFDYYSVLLQEARRALGTDRAEGLVQTINVYRGHLEQVFLSDANPVDYCRYQPALFGLCGTEELLLGGMLSNAHRLLLEAFQLSKVEFDGQRFWQEALEIISRNGQ
jgi:hypothetical protein